MCALNGCAPATAHHRVAYELVKIFTILDWIGFAGSWAAHRSCTNRADEHINYACWKRKSNRWSGKTAICMQSEYKLLKFTFAKMCAHKQEKIIKENFQGLRVCVRVILPIPHNFLVCDRLMFERARTHTQDLDYTLRSNLRQSFMLWWIWLLLLLPHLQSCRLRAPI